MMILFQAAYRIITKIPQVQTLNHKFDKYDCCAVCVHNLNKINLNSVYSSVDF